MPRVRLIAEQRHRVPLTQGRQFADGIGLRSQVFHECRGVRAPVAIGAILVADVLRTAQAADVQIFDSRRSKPISQDGLRKSALTGQGKIANIDDRPDFRSS